MKRTFACILILIAVFTVCSCNKTSEPGVTEEMTEQPFVLSAGDEVCIVIAEDAKRYETDAAYDIQDFLQARNVNADVQRDSEYQGEGTVISVGVTSLCSELINELAYEKWQVRVHGGACFLLAKNDQGINKAKQHFQRLCNFSEGTFSLEHGFLYEESAFDWGLPMPEGKAASGVFDCGDEATMVVYEHVSHDDFLNYVNTLEAQGYSKLENAELGKNDFHTFQKDSVRVVTYYTGAYSQMRIIKDKAISSYSTPTMGNAAVELFTTRANAKSAYVLRLADNSVIIFDGHIDGSFDRQTQINTFYDDLKAICSSENIRVSAWFISHVHADHTNLFNAMLSSEYAKKISVERVIVNVADRADFAAISNEAVNDYSNYIALQSTIRSYKAATNNNIELIKTHTGELFDFCGVKFRILYTHEDYLPRTYPISGTNLKGNGINSHSLVMQMSYNGKTVLWTGDMGHEMSQIVEKMYDTALKCDAVQVGHHGNNYCGYPSFYLKCDPDVLLWTNSYADFQEYVIGLNRAGAAVYEALKDKVSRNIFMGGSTMENYKF